MDIFITETIDEKGDHWAGPQINAENWDEAKGIAAKLVHPINGAAYTVVGKLVASMPLSELMLWNAKTDGKEH